MMCVDIWIMHEKPALLVHSWGLLCIPLRLVCISTCACYELRPGSKFSTVDACCGFSACQLMLVIFHAQVLILGLVMSADSLCLPMLAVFSVQVSILALQWSFAKRLPPASEWLSQSLCCMTARQCQRSSPSSRNR